MAKWLVGKIVSMLYAHRLVGEERKEKRCYDFDTHFIRPSKEDPMAETIAVKSPPIEGIMGK